MKNKDKTLLVTALDNIRNKTLTALDNIRKYSLEKNKKLSAYDFYAVSSVELEHSDGSHILIRSAFMEIKDYYIIIFSEHLDPIINAIEDIEYAKMVVDKVLLKGDENE